MPDDEVRGSASGAGYHYLNLYQNCNWKWHLKYNRHLEPLKLNRYLVFGQVFHIIKEAFYKQDIRAINIDDLCSHFKYELERRKDLYDKLDAYEEDLLRGPIMLRKWYEVFGSKDFDKYDIIAVEEEMRFNLPGGFQMTVRPDCVVQQKDNGLIYALETKTTSRSAPEMAKRVACEHQVDAQLMGITAMLQADDGGKLPKECSGVIPDIIYKKQSVCTATRDVIIQRSRKELADTSLSFAGIFAELSQKRAALDEGAVPEMLYSHNGSWCGNFGCEYAAVCRSKWTSSPPGFFLTASDEEAMQRAEE